jgi:hypothetical protein
MFRPQAPPELHSNNVEKTTYAILTITLNTLRDLTDAIPIPGLKAALGGILLIVSTAKVRETVHPLFRSKVR